MSVRKRVWFTRLQRKEIDPKAREISAIKGKPNDWKQHIDRAAESLGIQPQESWVVDYTDQAGDRHIKTFDKKKDADGYLTTVSYQVKEGVHTAPSKSIIVLEAAENWLKHVEREGRERSTVAQYRQHVYKHLKPLHHAKLAALTTPRINTFRDELLAELSRPLARKVLVSLKSLLREAQRRGDVAQNVALSVGIKMDKRDKRKLKAGVDFPKPEEIKPLIDAATGKYRALLVTVVFTGLRASELRGLRWEDVDLRRGELHVRQRADRYNNIGAPKSHSGERTIPLGPFVVNTLKEWKLACPKGDAGLVFPSSTGAIEHHANMLRALSPVMVKAGLVDKQGEPKYALHAFRHFYASRCINRKEDGGLELPAKVVQERLGHASILMTMDTYGHLFPRNDDTAELAASEKALLG
jgi:integrase